MERIRGLGRYQKWILIGMTVMVLVFAVLYPVTLRRVGFAYQGAILVPRVETERPYIPASSGENRRALLCRRIRRWYFSTEAGPMARIR